MNPFKLLFKVFAPTYQMSLSNQFIDKNIGKFVYRFKLYGMHEYVKVTYCDIMQNTQLMYTINPHDLMQIAVNEYQQIQVNDTYKILETLRNNHCKISNGTNEDVFSGEEICENISIWEKLDNIDLFKISYNTGFTSGRSLAKNLASVNNQPDTSREGNLSLVYSKM